MENQTHPSVLNAYPDGVRWQVNAAIGGADGLGDPAAILRADGSIQHSIAPWRYGSADTADERDKLRLLPFVTTVASAYGGSGSIALARRAVGQGSRHPGARDHAGRRVASRPGRPRALRAGGY